ncbi:hypothetical protein [Thalassospira alkalitolerans]|uniref:hypothetical protein n=1 Tax=Thalassospira alkalitolerans TaxID=1293890 RepID=UPI0030EF4743|tara:strand:+ start:15345 stop:16337 length:993 start_codon:yes stop_codon:yes gene_type:complete
MPLINYFLKKYRLRKVTYTPRRLTTRLSEIKIDRPLFFLRVQGGGLTILAKCFQRLNNTCFANGNSDSWDAADNEMHVCVTSKKLPKEFSFHTNTFYPPELASNFYRYWTYATDQALPHFRIEDPESVGEKSLSGFRDYIKAIIRAHAKDINSCRFVDKSQLYTINTPLIRKALADSSPYFAIFGRSPYGSVPRTAKNYYLNPNKHGFDMSYEDALKLCAQHWNNTFSIALKDCNEKQDNLFLKIEDFFADPDSFCRKICDFAELDFSTEMAPKPDQKNTIYEQMARRWYPIKKSSTDSALRSLTELEISIVNEICGKTMQNLGYELERR